MNSGKLLSVLRDIHLLKFVSVDELQKLADDYPYFQLSHILLAKKYLLENRNQFEDKLHKAAIYASDRTNLRSLMGSDLELGEKHEVSTKVVQQPVQSESAGTTYEEESIFVNENELSKASMNDTLPVDNTLLEEENYEIISAENTLSEATAMEELEVSLSHAEEAINEDELSHASMGDMLSPENTLLEEENYDVVVEDNTLTEATAMEELEAAALQPFEDAKVDELSHASMSDMLPALDTVLEEENYDVIVEDNSTAEAEAMEDIEIAATQPAYTNGKSVPQEFNINNPHTFSDWLKFIQNSPRALQHKSSAPDYHPISVPESFQTSTTEEVMVKEHQTVTLEEIVPIEHIPDVLAAEPTDNLQAIDEFVAETKPVVIAINESSIKQLADKSVEDTEELLTETLARIYAEQGLYNKAIRVYARLSLKFPEKSLYFAPLIKELKSKL